MFNLIARRINGIRLRATLKFAPTIDANVGSPLDKLDKTAESLRTI